MFCPKCAAQNLDGAHFCRSCGANISLVPQALTGQLAQPPMTEDKRGLPTRHGRRELTLEQPVQNFFLGIAFVIISIVLSRTIGQVWWFWLLIPAFGCFAKGFSELARVRMAKGSPQNAQPHLNSVRPPDLPAPRTGELMTPVPSVTESTTRHLSEAPTQHRDSNQQQRPS